VGFGGTSRRGAKFSLASPGELHAIDVTTSSEVISVTPVFALLNGCTRGDDVADRTGRRIHMKRLDYYINVWQKTTAPLQNVRVWVFYDRRPNGAICAFTDLMTSAAVTCQPNFSNRDRFKILLNKIFTFPPIAGGAGVNQLIHGSIRLNLPVDFGSGNAGTVADMGIGSLYLVAIGESGTGNSANDMRAVTRVTFSDL